MKKLNFYVYDLLNGQERIDLMVNANTLQKEEKPIIQVNKTFFCFYFNF
jgi:hypothetical protein